MRAVHNVHIVFMDGVEQTIHQVNRTNLTESVMMLFYDEYVHDQHGNAIRYIAVHERGHFPLVNIRTWERMYVERRRI